MSSVLFFLGSIPCLFMNKTPPQSTIATGQSKNEGDNGRFRSLMNSRLNAIKYKIVIILFIDE